jgi:hypothetical protein
VQRVDVHIRNGDKWLEISDDGEYECDNTSGEPSCTARSTCDCCGDRFHDDDMYLVGRDDEEQVCTGCHDNAYTYVLGRRRRAYHISSADAVYIDSQSCYYDVNYLGENNIVELSNGDYEHADNAVHIESTNEWYASDDSDVCYDEYNERHELVDNCVNTEDMGYVHANDTWQCCATDKYYSDSVDYVEIDGELYHPDHAPVVEESEDNIKE